MTIAWNRARHSWLPFVCAVAAAVAAPLVSTPCRAQKSAGQSSAPPAAAAAQAPPAAATPSPPLAQNNGNGVVALESTALRLEVTASPYSYRVIEKSSGDVLLAQDSAAVTFAGEMYPASDAVNIAHPNDVSLTLDLYLQTQGLDPLPPGTPPRAQVKFTFIAPEQLQITIGLAAVAQSSASNAAPPAASSSTSAGPAAISEQFADRGEHYYGIWEYPFGGNIDDRGADHDFLGLGNNRYVNHSSVRAPFYLTSRGYGIYVESLARGHFSIAQAGHTSFSFDAPSLTYDIIYGPSYADIFRRYNAIAGPTVLPPAWAFGSIWWRDDEHEDLRRAANAQEKVLDDADHLRALHIPAGAIWLDRPYGSGEDGWGSMDFDSSFPNPQKLVDDVNARGMQLLLWISDRASGKVGADGADQKYVFPGYTWPGIDIRRPEVYDWFKGLLGAYVNLGIKGYKLDRGDEGEMPDSAENEISALMPKLAAESLEPRNGDDFFMFARNADDTARRYTAVWNGDSWSTFSGLQMSVKNALRAGAIDFPVWGSDTGGYFQRADKELLARWIEFSSYSPLMEVLIGPNRTIWDDYDDETVAIARDAAQRHADLIPYTRSLVNSSRASGLPVMRALVFAFPQEQAALADTWDEYMFGDNLLVAPVLEAGARTRTVYLPGAAEPDSVGAELASARVSSAPDSPAATSAAGTATGKGTSASARSASATTNWLEFSSSPRSSANSAPQRYLSPAVSPASTSTDNAETPNVQSRAEKTDSRAAPFTIFRGGTTVTVPAPLGTMPVFIREGAIIPRGDIVQLNNNWFAEPSASAAIEATPAEPAASAAQSSAQSATPAPPPPTPAASASAAPVRNNSAARDSAQTAVMPNLQPPPPASSAAAQNNSAPAASANGNKSADATAKAQANSPAAANPSAPPSAQSAAPAPTPAPSAPQSSPQSAPNNSAAPNSSAPNAAPPAAPAPSATQSPAGNSSPASGSESAVSPAVASAKAEWSPTLRIEIFPGRTASAFSYYTGTQSAAITVEPIAAATPDSLTAAPAPAGFKIEFPDLGLSAEPAAPHAAAAPPAAVDADSASSSPAPSANQPGAAPFDVKGAGFEVSSPRSSANSAPLRYLSPASPSPAPFATKSTLEIFCRANVATLSVTRNGAPLSAGKDFTYDPRAAKLTVPFDGATIVVIRGAATLFAAPPPLASSPASAPAASPSAQPPAPAGIPPILSHSHNRSLVPNSPAAPPSH